MEQLRPLSLFSSTCSGQWVDLSIQPKEVPTILLLDLLSVNWTGLAIPCDDFIGPFPPLHCGRGNQEQERRALRTKWWEILIILPLRLKRRRRRRSVVPIRINYFETLLLELHEAATQRSLDPHPPSTALLHRRRNRLLINVPICNIIRRARRKGN